MTDKNKCILLGTLAKTLGIDGSLILRLSEFERDDTGELKFVFIEIDGFLVPFFIDVLKERSSREYIVKFMDIDTAEQAAEFTGSRVFTNALSTTSPKNTLPERNVKGYRVLDVRLGFVGTAAEILYLAQNPLLKAIKDEHEYLIPFHPDIICEINNRKKTITIESPDGLFDL
jgi:16S rRNA processing protein RimM